MFLKISDFIYDYCTVSIRFLIVVGMIVILNSRIQETCLSILWQLKILAFREILNVMKMENDVLNVCGVLATALDVV